MTTGLSVASMATGHESRFEATRARRIILALLATFCIALALTSANRIPRWDSNSNPLREAAGLISIPHVESAAPVQQTPPKAAGPAAQTLAEMDALADLVAKKYRISVDATREVISTAYGEAHRVGLDPLLILAVISIESRFNPIARSEAGAMGLMQIIPTYHKDRLGSHPGAVLDPITNIRVGTLVLKEYIQRSGTETAGLQRYNGASDDATNKYANKVLGEKMLLQRVAQRAREGLRI